MPCRLLWGPRRHSCRTRMRVPVPVLAGWLAGMHLPFCRSFLLDKGPPLEGKRVPVRPGPGS